LTTLSNQVSAALSQVPNGAALSTFAQNEIAMSEFVLDGLANELVAAGGSPTDAAVDAALADAALGVDELNVLNSLGISSGSSGTGSGSTSGSGSGSTGSGSTSGSGSGSTSGSGSGSTGGSGSTASSALASDNGSHPGSGKGHSKLKT
jgi:hypothetical protein